MQMYLKILIVKVYKYRYNKEVLVFFLFLAATTILDLFTVKKYSIILSVKTAKELIDRLYCLTIDQEKRP